MPVRIATLNLEQDHKRWPMRRALVHAELARLRPDVLALNEVSIPLQTARGLRDFAGQTTGVPYNLVQQTRANGLSEVEGEALLSRFAVIETGNLDFRTHDIVALVARLTIDAVPVDVYVTHLYRSVGDDSQRLFQVQRLLAWIDSRQDVGHVVVCGDFNATLDQPSAALMASRFRPTQSAPTAFTPLADDKGAVSHPYWPRMDRCIDYIWLSERIRIVGSGTCFDKPGADDPTLWPSDHAGVWADLEFT
jgi:endonuclease/exonuclease/phosphatase family metal-dependent hydrolase